MKLVRVLNDAGVQKFREYLGSLKAGDTAAPPTELLDDPATSEVFHSAIEIEKRDFGSRLAAAEYLLGKLGGKGDVDYNSGLWSWLALFYFDQICPPADDGSRLIGEEARYIPGTISWRYYRHLLAGPFRVYESGPHCQDHFSRPISYGFTESFLSFRHSSSRRMTSGGN